MIATGFCDRCHVLTSDEVAELRGSEEIPFTDALRDFIRKQES